VLKGKTMAKAVDYFLLEPLRLKHMNLWKFRVSQLLHERTNGKFDALYMNWRRRTAPPAALSSGAFLDDAAVARTGADLKRDGCSILPRLLPEETIRQITEFAFSTPTYGRGAGESVMLDQRNIPTEFGRYVWSMQSLAALPAVQQLLLDDTFHKIAQDYLSARPLLTSMSLWLDPPYKGKYGAHQYHYDNDGPGFLKFFFYLTDVEPDTGAHCYIKGTHGHVKPGPFKLSKIYADDELLSYYGQENEVVFAAPKGTIIAEDTAGFHRGSSVKRGYRLLMQFQFSLLDIPHEEDLSRSVTPLPVQGLDPKLAPILKKFYRAV
jgi:hypothetical protein